MTLEQSIDKAHDILNICGVKPFEGRSRLVVEIALALIKASESTSKANSKGLMPIIC